MNKGIIIPCYNEAERLPLNDFAAFVNTHKNYILCFVNDGSKDDTLAILQNFAKGKESNVMVYDMPQNGGKAEAVRQGTNFLIEQTNVESVGFLDADLATGFEDYLMLERTLSSQNKKFILGSRKLGGTQDIQRSFMRDLVSNVIGLLIRAIVGLPIKDTQCGAKVFNRATAQYIFKTPFSSKWLFDVEMLIRIKKLYKSNVLNHIQEVAISKWDEVEGSHITLKDSLSFPFKLMEIAYIYNVKPTLEMVFSFGGLIGRRVAG